MAMPIVPVSSLKNSSNQHGTVKPGNGNDTEQSYIST